MLYIDLSIIKAYYIVRKIFLMELNINNMDTLMNAQADAILLSVQEKKQNEEKLKKYHTLRQKIEVELRDLLDEENLLELNKADLLQIAKTNDMNKEDLDKIALSYFYINGKRSMYLLFVTLLYVENGISGCDLKKAEHILRSYYEDKLNTSNNLGFSSIFSNNKCEKSVFEAMYRFFVDIVSLPDIDRFDFIKNEVNQYVNSDKKMMNYFKTKNEDKNLYRIIFSKIKTSV
jgi:hypothetical protein